MKTAALKDKWTVCAIVFALTTAAVYLLTPLFAISLFGIETGLDYVKLLWRFSNLADSITFMLPLIGALGVLLTVWGGRAVHILTMTFSLLPAMFYAFFLVRMASYIHKSVIGEHLVSLTDLIGYGTWLGLFVAFCLLLAGTMIVMRDTKKFKSGTKYHKP